MFLLNCVLSPVLLTQQQQQHPKGEYLLFSLHQWTPLHNAVKRSQNRVVKYLAGNQVDVDIKGNQVDVDIKDNDNVSM